MSTCIWEWAISPIVRRNPPSCSTIRTHFVNRASDSAGAGPDRRSRIWCVVTKIHRSDSGAVQLSGSNPDGFNWYSDAIGDDLNIDYFHDWKKTIRSIRLRIGSAIWRSRRPEHGTRAQYRLRLIRYHGMGTETFVESDVSLDQQVIVQLASTGPETSSQPYHSRQANWRQTTGQHETPVRMATRHLARSRPVLQAWQRP